MKKLKRLIIAALLFCFAFTFAGCGKTGDTIVADPNTINVKVYKGGYNSEYIYALKEKFETLYADNGYKVNILTPQRAIKGVAVLQEIYADSKVDMYFANEVGIEQGVSGEYGLCLTDITESVYNKKPIKFDGSEEDTLIKDKLNPTSSFDITASDGKYYGLPYVEGMGGMVFNKKVLSEYGMDTPRTTDELFECYAAIMKKAADTGVYPFTYISGANNYPAHMTNLWLAQYGGKDYYEKFWTMNNSDGTQMKTDGYTVFEDKAVEVMLRALYEAFDYQAAAFGSMTQDLSTAQAQIMRGSAVFMSAGDYFFHEEALSFTQELKDISFMNTPVISELGTLLFGPQSTYGLTDEKADDVLSEIVRLADENKSVAEIIAAVSGGSLAVTLNENDVARVCEARGYTYNRTGQHTALISAKSDKKEICELFLRMCASDDGAKLIAQKTYASNPFTGSVYSDSEYVFLREADKVANNVYKTVLNAQARGYRAEIGLSEIFPQTGTYIQNEIVNDQKTIYNDYGEVVSAKTVYADAARERATLIVNHAKENWSKWAK